MKTIRYYVRSVYGVERVYLADSEQAAQVSTLTRRKTVERADLLALAALGCDLLQVTDPRFDAAGFLASR